MLQTLFFRSREQGAAVLGAQEQVCIYQHDQYHPCFQVRKLVVAAGLPLYAVEFAGSRECYFKG